jgi:WD40 repeat protein
MDGLNGLYPINPSKGERALNPFILSVAALIATVVAVPAQGDEKAVRTDRYGDPLPEGAVARIGTTRLRHAAAVTSLAFWPDGKRISSASMWFDVGVWDARTGQSLAFRSREEKRLLRAAVSPDGSLFAGRTDNGELGVQEALSGKILHRFAGKKDLCDGLVFSRDNRWLASADSDGNIFLWDLQSGKLAHQFKTKPQDTFDHFCHAFTPDGKVFIQARPDDITLWSVRTGKEIRRIDSKKEGEWPAGAAVSPDGELLAIRIGYGRVDIWEIKTGRHLRKIAEEWNEVGPVFSPDGKHVVTGGGTGKINFWEVETGDLDRTLTVWPEEHPTSFAFSPDGKFLASGRSDHAIRIWDLASGKELLPVSHRLGGTPSARFLPDGKTLLVQCQYDLNRIHAIIDGRLSFWGLQGNCVRQAELDPDRAHAHALSSDARTVVYGTGPNFGLSFEPTPNGYLKSSIRLCDAASGKQLFKVDDVRCQIHDFTFSPDDSFLLVNAQNAGPNEDDFHRIDTLQLWKRKSPTSLERIADIPMRSFLSGYCVSPDSRWVAVTSEAGYRFHDCETGKLIRSYPDAPGSVVAVSPSGRVLVSRDAEDARTDKVVLVWEQATGKLICKLDCKPGQTDFAPLAVSPDGKYIAGCLDREVIALWDAFTGKQLGTLEGHRGDIGSLFFSPDGRFLVSASDDTTLLVWDWKKKLPKTPEDPKLSAERLEQLWRDLQASDPQRAYAAIGLLVQSPGQAVELLRKKMHPASTDEHDKFKQWIDELDSDRFQVRENAMKELTSSGELAEAALREALARRVSPEARRRVTQVLDKLPTAAPHSTTLATLRSLEVLEMINTPEARAFIDELIRGTGDPIRKREAEQTFKRVIR